MLDFRNYGDKEEGAVIVCDCCGRTTMVSRSHGAYCPVCGPDVITPITMTYGKKDVPEKADDRPGRTTVDEWMHIPSGMTVDDGFDGYMTAPEEPGLYTLYELFDDRNQHCGWEWEAEETMLAKDIDWDVDGSDSPDLPAAAYVPRAMADDIEKVSEWLTKTYEHCHGGFTLCGAEYDYVTFAIDGRYVVKVPHVDGETPEDTIARATERYYSADFGELECIGAEAVMIEDKDGEYVWEK